MKTQRVLIVDDDPKELEKHAGMLSGVRYTVHKARGLAEAAGILKKHRGKVVVVSELFAGGKCGIAFMKDMLTAYPYLPFTFLVSAPPLESVIETMREGAYDFLLKPVAKDVLCRSVARSMAHLNLMLEADKREAEIRERLSRNEEDLQDARTRSSFKGFMISMAAHDFRTIITVLDGYLQFIREKCQACPISATDGLMHRANRTVARLLTMANTLLDYEAAETGRIRVEIKPFPLDEALRECIAFYKPYADQKRIDLSLDREGPEIVVKADREKVMEILDNLLYNALKFTPAKGTIRLSGKEARGRFTLFVSDSGPGIPKEKLRNLFNQENMVATLDSHARLGLGMTICKRLVEAQNGKIKVNSVVGKGTTVSFSFPSL